jgi:hypothetical protein
MICVISSRYFWLWSRFQTPDSEVCSSPGLAVFCCKQMCCAVERHMRLLFACSLFLYGSTFSILNYCLGPVIHPETLKPG